MSYFLREFIYHIKPQFLSDFKTLQTICLKANFFKDTLLITWAAPLQTEIPCQSDANLLISQPPINSATSKKVRINEDHV